MLLKSRFRIYLLVTSLILPLIFTFSCDQRDRYAGVYFAQGGELLESSEAYIELKEDGQGVWSVLDDEVSFRWSVKGNEIRLHTKSGGVIVGKIKDDTLEIALPGRVTRHFKRSK